MLHEQSNGSWERDGIYRPMVEHGFRAGSARRSGSTSMDRRALLPSADCHYSARIIASTPHADAVTDIDNHPGISLQQTFMLRNCVEKANPPVLVFARRNPDKRCPPLS